MNSGRFVGHKGNKQWIWLSIDASTRVIIGVYIGERSRTGAMDSGIITCGLSTVCCLLYRFLGGICKVIPAKRYPRWEGNWQNNHIEDSTILYVKKNSRLVRKATSFSKKLNIWSYLVFHSLLQRLFVCLGLTLYHYYAGPREFPERIGVLPPLTCVLSSSIVSTSQRWWYS